jgi:hypothetical protein
MTDREFLCLIHKTLEHKYKEDPLSGYMYILRSIIAATPPDKQTPMARLFTSLEDIEHI